jgi:hypothetical protein
MLDFDDRLLLVANGVVQLVIAMRCQEEVVKVSPSLNKERGLVASTHTNNLVFGSSCQ